MVVFINLTIFNSNNVFNLVRYIVISVMPSRAYMMTSSFFQFIFLNHSILKLAEIFFLIYPNAPENNILHKKKRRTGINKFHTFKNKTE